MFCHFAAVWQRIGLARLPFFVRGTITQIDLFTQKSNHPSFSKGLDDRLVMGV
jgi:hypothetical protein